MLFDCAWCYSDEKQFNFWTLVIHRKTHAIKKLPFVLLPFSCLYVSCVLCLVFCGCLPVSCVLRYVFCVISFPKGNGKPLSYSISISSKFRRRLTLNTFVSSAFCRMSCGGGGGAPNSPHSSLGVCTGVCVTSSCCLGLFTGVTMIACDCCVVTIRNLCMPYLDKIYFNFFFKMFACFC